MASKDFEIVSAAAKRGDKDAMYCLALMYARGEGVAKDDGQAGAWMMRAAEKGQRNAVADIKNMGATARSKLIVSGIAFLVFIVLNLIIKNGGRIMAAINAGVINVCTNGLFDNLMFAVVAVDATKTWLWAKIIGGTKIILGLASFIFWITVTIQSCGGKQIDNKLYLFLMNPDDYIGAAMLGMVNPVEPPVKITVLVPEPVTAVVTANALNLRSGPGTNNAVLKAVRKGDELIVTGSIKSGWLPVEHLGTKGYVSSEMVSIKSGVAGNVQKTDFKITKLEAGNSDINGEWITEAGAALNAVDVRFLKPVITYNASISGEVTFYVKIINQEGKLRRNAEFSPEGYTYESKRNIKSGAETSLTLPGWGGENAGSYPAGLYTIEVWCDGLCLRSEKIRIN